MIHLLKLYNFRIFNSLELDFSSDKVFIRGKNNSGKTSILEALYVICNGHSFRSSDLKKLIRYNDSFFSIEIANDTAVKLMYGKDKGKHYFINEKKSSNSSMGSAFICYNRFINDFIFALDFRRGIIDECISLLDQDYYSSFINYKQYLTKKKEVIRSASADKKQKHDYLLLLNKSISKDVEILVKTRKTISENLNEFYLRFSDYSVKYKSQFIEEKGSDSILNKIEFELNCSVEQEINFQKTKRYHSDDFILYHENHDIRSHGSYSAYKMIYFYTILYFLIEYKTQKEKNPFLLFDDFFNGIDSEGQKSILKSIPDDISVFFAQCEQFEIMNNTMQLVDI